MKKEKGITLVALIITIIVLLILAVVTINAVNEGNLFAHANNAATAYSEKAAQENSLISNYISMIEEYDSNQKAPFDPNKPLIGQTFYMLNQAEGSGMAAYKNVTDTTMDILNMDKGAEYETAEYVYNPTTKVLTITTQDNDTIIINFLKLEDNMILYGDGTGQFVSTNLGTGTSLLPGYSATNAGGTKTFQFGADNSVTISEGGNEEVTRYYVADDNSSNSGEYNMMIGWDMYKVTKEDGNYIQFVEIGNDTVYTLTMP